MARFFNNYKVALCPGVTGKQLSTGLEALDDGLRPLYGLHGMPCELTNMFCLGAGAMTGGGRPSDQD